ncbi:dipeptide/oligopeptide/nickel ABC transporter permease/ATP-binding protein [Flexivirga sp. ID2601S]|uniref:Dipeptide/oligopeptide/nickel ABC transporter permease/ATP-binding protein n=1 Tax=Flexivirga aerilata TaxID=1656889 RepID=A0A849AFB5_9MICO|nr:dipeptide/oligopeptide/nickel ABC transporter permease/ATP-binding protein [Flexivirga aerilata]NNG38266.1 dipeptide/oligopeptide/nickel ABC transporter permease/ATP-binding protein [Flexivirga aerilata]
MTDNQSRGFAARFMRKPLAVASLAYVTLIVICVVFAGVLAPYGPEDQDLGSALSGPSSQHLLGAGELGKDVLSRMLYGGRITLLGVLISVVVFIAVGVPAGMVAGYKGGLIDKVVLRLADAAYAIPVVIILLVVLAIFPGNESIAMVVLGLLGAPGLARVVRSVTLGVRGELYIRAAKVSGLSDAVILRRHVLPRLAGPVIVQLSLFGAAAVGLETGLGFLGLGVNQATWGTLVAEASTNIGNQPWLLVPSGLLIASYILALGLIGDGVRDATAERYSLTRPSKNRQVANAPVVTGSVAPDQRSAAPADALLSVRNLHVAFDIDGAETEVVTGVGFDLRAGEALGIVGESGSGKTVTATALVRLLRGSGRITAGSVVFDGTDLMDADGDTLRRVRGGGVGFIGQDPISGLDPSFTIGAQIAEVIRTHRRCSRSQARAAALDLLGRVKLPDPERAARSYVHQLSGGMAQRAGIAAALAGEPSLVIADEPTTALDVTVQADILDLLRELQDSGVAVILVTHDWGVLADLCERAIVMYAGQVVETASVRMLLDNPGHPYTAGLLGANPQHAVRGKPLPSIEGSVPPPRDWPTGCRFASRCPLVVAACRAEPVTLEPVGSAPDHAARCIRQEDVVAPYRTSERVVTLMKGVSRGD